MRLCELEFNPREWVGKTVVIHNEGGAGRALSVILCDASLPIEEHLLLRLVNVDIGEWLGKDNVVSGVLLDGGVKDDSFFFCIAEVMIVATCSDSSEVEFLPFMDSWKQ
jgi:hypothetical protein